MWQADPNFNIVLIVVMFFAVMAVIPLGIALLIANNSQKRREADLIKLAIEKGQPVPSFPKTVSRYGTLKAAFIWIAVGIGVILMMLIENSGRIEGVSLGFIPLLIGIALVISWVLEKRETESGRPNV